MSDAPGLKERRGTPMVEIPVLNKFKRKRADSPEAMSPQRMQPNKKRRPEHVTLDPVPSTDKPLNAKAASSQTFTHDSEVLSHDRLISDLASKDAVNTITAPPPGSETKITEEPREMDNSGDVSMLDAQQTTSDDATSLSPIQQVIENEFNMQILMKHNELRLIEQELAKCQIALEQLRRCEIRPFPGSNQPAESISTGTGPAILPQAGYTRPSHAAPYGVTDGPYTRHYRHWLLNDPQFDSVPVQSAVHLESLAQAAGRPTRNSGSARKSVSQPSFRFPGRPSESLQSIPNYPAAAPKDKSAPLILRRSTDRQLVKLVCNNCLRGNFSSIQGFLNHCRIAHKVDYKSHDAAAIDCGRTLDEQETANLPPETLSTPVSKPTIHKPNLSRTSTSTSTPFRNFVHPFNTATGVPMAFNSNRQASGIPKAPVQSLNAGASSTAGSPFRPSSAVPRLSAQFVKHQLSGDLESAAASAKEKIDLGVGDEDLPSPDASEQNSPLEPLAGSRTVTGTGKARKMTGAAPQPPSQKGFRMPQQRPRPSPLAPASARTAQQDHSEIPESPQFPGPNLSPNTADSNPGLVSDHEDDDHGSGSDEEAPQTEMRQPFTVGGNCSDNMEIEVTEDDDIDRSGVIIRRGSMFADEERGLRTSGTSSMPKKFGASK